MMKLPCYLRGLILAGAAIGGGDGLSIIAGDGTANPPTPGPATSSPLNNPSGVAVDSSGNVYIADPANNVIEKVTPAGTLSIFAGTGSGGWPTAGRATNSKLNYPSGVAVDSSDNVYIADSANNLIEKVTPAGTLSIYAGTGSGAAPTVGPATNSALNYPVGVAIDSSGNLYILDVSNNLVEKVTPAGTLSIFAGSGHQGTPVSGGATSSSFNNPHGIAVDSTGNVYIADSYNNAVEKVTPAGTLSIFAGTGSGAAPTVGPATSSALTFPSDVAVDSTGNVYIVDAGSKVVVRVDSLGILSIVAGIGASGTPVVGPALASPFDFPQGIAVDSLGNFYISNNQSTPVVMKVTTQHSPVAPLRPAPPTGTVGDNSLTVSWTAPVTGGSAITSYKVQLNGVDYDFPATTTSWTFTSDPYNGGIANGTSYVVALKATNAIGASPYSVTSELLWPGYLPLAPGSVSAAPTQNGHLLVSWSASKQSSGNGGWRVSSYSVAVTRTDYPPTLVKTITTTSGASRQADVGGLSIGSSYEVTVTPISMNGVGAGKTSSTVSLGAKPSTPLWVSGNDGLRKGDGTLRGWWAASVSNGAEVTYTIRVTYNSLKNQTRVLYGTYSTKNNYILLKHVPVGNVSINTYPGRNYQFELRATNKFGTSAPTFRDIWISSACKVVANADCPSYLD
jgi:hypothetical protein